MLFIKKQQQQQQHNNNSTTAQQQQQQEQRWLPHKRREDGHFVLREIKVSSV
jgi:hypothetical protein